MAGKQKHIVGIDEVGRGPLAGPVAVGAVLVYREHYSKVAKLFPVIKDSKKLTEKTREVWLEKIMLAQGEGLLQTAVSFISALEIDKKGIAPSIRKALRKSLSEVYPKPGFGQRQGQVRVLLDGGLKAPEEYEDQETIIKGDEKELAIALASIVAKVARDTHMRTLARKVPQYGFEKHKGYGTRAHYEAIKKHGISTHHRKTFLKGIA